jgi:hypothetical protein
VAYPVTAYGIAQGLGDVFLADNLVPKARTPLAV